MLGSNEYFDLLISGPKAWPIAAYSLLFVIIGITALIFIRKRELKHSRGVHVFLYFWTGAALLFSVLSFTIVFGEYLSLRNALLDGQYKTVEGVVTNFHPMPYQGHENETFVIEGKRFAYSDYEVTNAFNNTKSHGGPIDEGKYIRIDYYDGKSLVIGQPTNKILRLWIRE